MRPALPVRLILAGCVAGLALVRALPVSAAEPKPAAPAKPAAFVESPFYALSDDVRRSLALRKEPATNGQRIGEIPAGARGIEGRSCRGPSDVAWDHLSPALRAALAKERWCRVRWQGVEGWVSARFLRPDSGPAAAAPAASAAPAPAPGRRPEPVAGAKPVPKSDASFVGPEWRVASVGDVEIRGGGAWLRFTESGDIEGHTGCNLLRAPYVAGTTALRFGPLAVTRMMCRDDALAREERLFLAALESVEAQQVSSGALRLLDGAGSARIVLRTATR